MHDFILLALISFILICITILLNNSYDHIIGDTNYLQIQKIHTHNVPRIGGIPILIAVAIYIKFFNNDDSLALLRSLLYAALPVTIMGAIEDITKRISVKIRMVSAVISAILFVGLSDATIQHIDIFTFSLNLYSIPFLACVFSVFCIVGAINAFNIIDGLNGLASSCAIFSLTGICVLSNIVHDSQLRDCTITILLPVCVFFVINFTTGKIFLGDCGAYLLGFAVSCLSIMLVATNNNVSVWAPIILSFYPIYETVYSIYRRHNVLKVNATKADDRHLHQFMYRYLLNKIGFRIPVLLVHCVATSIFVVFMIFNLLIVIKFWYNSNILLVYTMLLIVAYHRIYSYLVKCQEK